MNRKTLDIAIPTVFAAVMALTALFGAGSKTVSAVALVGGMGIGLYYAALRKNIKE
ncbi:hypothetical protein [Streptosporangium sp. NPDC000396]|uniref:hypothetical protein n=1 Tax=Streptosporangium sp. NPDC000396 TaxID=3366185 RepID=UPI0036C566D8